MSKRIVQCTTLGKNGRFANSVIQYLFAKAYARHTDSTLEINQDWIGFKIFDIKENEPSCVLPRTKIDQFPDCTNIDLYGYWSCKECMSLISKSDLNNWLIFKKELVNHRDKLRKVLPNRYSVSHIRRGDYLNKYSNMYCIPTIESYINAHSKYSPEIYNIWISEESPFDFKNNEIDQYLLNNDITFINDFFIITMADVIYRANSTFSWLGACMSINNNTHVYSPKVGSLVGENYVEFVKGNDEPLINGNRFGTYHNGCDIK
jgi:hypothetical protein